MTIATTKVSVLGSCSPISILRDGRTGAAQAMRAGKEHARYIRGLPLYLTSKASSMLYHYKGLASGHVGPMEPTRPIDKD